MAKFRNVSGEARTVGYGCPQRIVEPDDVVSVVPEAAISYAGQDIWEPVDDAAHDAVAEHDAALAMFAPPELAPPAPVFTPPAPVVVTPEPEDTDDHEETKP